MKNLKLKVNTMNSPLLNSLLLLLGVVICLCINSSCNKSVEKRNYEVEANLVMNTMFHHWEKNFSVFNSFSKSFYQSVNNFNQNSDQQHGNCMLNWSVLSLYAYSNSAFMRLQSSSSKNVFKDFFSNKFQQIFEPQYIDEIIKNEALYPDLTPGSLNSLHDINTNSKHCIGFHAIEYVLFGFDKSIFGNFPLSANDFFNSTTNERRRKMLVSLSEDFYLNTPKEEQLNQYIRELKSENQFELLKTTFKAFSDNVRFTIYESGILNPLAYNNMQYELCPSSDYSIDCIKMAFAEFNYFVQGIEYNDSNVDQNNFYFNDLLMKHDQPLAKRLRESANTVLNSLYALDEKSSIDLLLASTNGKTVLNDISNQLIALMGVINEVESNLKQM